MSAEIFEKRLSKPENYTGEVEKACILTLRVKGDTRLGSRGTTVR